MIYKKYYNTIIRWWLTGVGLTSIVSALAIPAKPGIIKIRQCNGSDIELVLKGDEHNHAWFTPDGYPLVHESDMPYLCFLKLIQKLQRKNSSEPLAAVITNFSLYLTIISQFIKINSTFA